MHFNIVEREQESIIGTQMRRIRTETEIEFFSVFKIFR